MLTRSKCNVYSTRVLPKTDRYMPCYIKIIHFLFLCNNLAYRKIITSDKNELIWCLPCVRMWWYFTVRLDSNTTQLDSAMVQCSASWCRVVVARVVTQRQLLVQNRTDLMFAPATVRCQDGCVKATSNILQRLFRGIYTYVLLRRGCN